MLKPDEEQQRAIYSLKSNPSFYKIMQMLDEELDFCMKGLMTASDENVHRLQGRTKLLDELIKTLNHND